MYMYYVFLYSLSPQPNQSRSVLSLGSTASSKSLGPIGMPQVIRTEVTHHLALYVEIRDV